jgi:GDP/UDP-N,N'-diacetylbacillosamine 2-epimerase (hydrolysing)
MKIAIATGTRADFGLLRPLIQEIQKDTFFETKVWVTAMHLSEQFGLTKNEIIAAGIPIDQEIPCLEEGDDTAATSKTIANAVVGFAEAIKHSSPELIVILGDRTEMLGAAIACTIGNIPIAHIHGGETTEGAYDESIRHAITKMSFLHFTSAEAYRDRVIQLGEHPSRVFNVGAIGIDSILNLKLLSLSDLQESLNFKFLKKMMLVTYHPVTLEEKSSKSKFLEILKVLDELENTGIIFTHANSDKNGLIINEMIIDYCKQNPKNTIQYKSLGQLRYLSSLQYVDVVLGNSSSGVIEVPYFNIPTVNIGDRQKGRLTPSSVIHCEPNYTDIKNALKIALSENFRKSIKKQPQIYGNGSATNAIISILKNNGDANLKKQFYDLPKPTTPK